MLHDPEQAAREHVARILREIACAIEDEDPDQSAFRRVFERYEEVRRAAELRAAEPQGQPR